jgi:hypothetical protein
VPTDRELVDQSRAIVIATAMSSYSIRTSDGFIDTVYELRVDEVIKGDVNPSVPLQLVEMGGFLDGHADVVPGSPRYATGERALIFVGTNNRGEASTWGMVLGKFNFVHDLHGRKLLIRGADEGEIFGWDACWNRHQEPFRSESGFLEFVRAAACGRSASENYLVPKSDIASRQPRPDVNSGGFHAYDYQDRVGIPSAFIIPGTVNGGIRWQGIFDSTGGGGSQTFVVVGSQASAADYLGGISRAMNAWNGNSQSRVNYIRGAAGPAGSTAWADDGINSIHLDDTVHTGGATGFARYYGTCACYAFDGATMLATTNADVAIKPGIGQAVFDEVVTHELGHTLSIRHSGDRPPTGSAVMNALCCVSGGAILQPWDRDAVSTIYNPNPSGGPPCTPPSITSATANPATITAGQSSTLTATAAGTNPTYQWYQGSPPSTTNPLAPGASVAVMPSATTTYWVRATACNTNADSGAVTVTVNAAVCTPVSITSQPADQSVNAGGTVQLSVGFTGSAPVTVTWYRGVAPDTSQGSIGSGQTIFSPPITQPTQFWAQLSNCSGTSTINTRTVTVIIASSCAPPSGLSAVASPTSISPGQQVTLTVFPSIGTQPFQFQWFTGVFPDTSNPINGATSSSVTVSPTATTSYWARATNSCGNAGSNTVTVTVNTGPGCTPPSITAQPVSDTIVVGTTTTLSVAAAGTGTLHYQWFQGSTGDTSAPVGTDSPNFTTPPVTGITSFWVRVTGQCTPPADSTTATLRIKRGRQQAVRH